MIEIINFRASTIEPNPKEVTYWVDLNEDPLGGIIKNWDGEGHWRTLRVLEGSIVKVEERIHEWVTLKLAELTEWVEGTVKDMTDLVHTWDGRITLVEDKVAKFEELKQDKLIPGFGISIDSNNIISSTVDLSLYRVVPELPTEYIDDTKIYIVFDPDGEGTNTHKEYVYLNGKWELLGEYADYASRTEFLLEVEDRKSADNKLTEDLNTVDNKAKALELWKSKIVPYKVLDRIRTVYLDLNGIGNLLLEFDTFSVNGDDPKVTSLLSLPEATIGKNGLMSNTDKIKLDTTLPNLITAETNARTTADTTITNNLNKEILDRKDAVSGVTTTLNNEIQERKDADIALNSLIGSVSNETNDKIDAEITRSTNKDIAHELSIANEITRAKAAEKVNTDAITEEVTRSKAAEVTLQTNLNTTNTNLSNEITRAKAAEKTNADNLASEIERSTNKDTALQTSITTETTRATNAEIALGTRTTTLESDNTTNKSNISTLQSNLSPIKTAWDKRGTKDGLLTLGDGGLISSQYLPSYVDDVIDAYATYDVSPTNQISNIKLYSNAAHTTAIVGESGKSYNDVTNGHPGYQFRWSGTAWVLITSGGLIIGNITGTAYDGAKGKETADTVKSLPINIVSDMDYVTYFDNKIQMEYYKTNLRSDGTYSPISSTYKSISAATNSSAGVMTAADKTKLDNATSGLTASTLMMRDVNGDANVRYLYNDSILDTSNPVDYVNFMTGSNRIIRKCTLSRLRDNISDISLRSGWLQRNTTLLYGTNGLQFFDLDGIAGTDPAANVTPTAGWHYIIRTNHANADGYHHDIAIPFTTNGSMLRRNVIKGVNYGWYTILDSYNWNLIIKYEQLSDKLNVSVDATPNSIVLRSSNSYISTNNAGVLFTDTSTNTAAKNAWVITTNTAYGGNSYDLKISQYITGTKGNLLLNGVPVATAGHRYIMTLYPINASGLDENTYYPVTIPLYSGGNFRIEVLTSLNNTVPSWSSHVSGFTVRFVEEVQGNGWGATPIRRRILDSVHNYVRDAYPPIGKVTQMSNSSTEVIWVRGGGLYYFYTSGTGSNLITPVLRTAAYTANEQTVAPIPVADKDNSIVRNVVMNDDAVYESEANSIVRRDSNGYVKGVRFYTTTPDEDYAISHIAYFYSSDGFIRKTPLSGLNRQLRFDKLLNIVVNSNEFNILPSTYSKDTLWLNYKSFTYGSTSYENTATAINRVYIGNGQTGKAYVNAKGFEKEGSSDRYALTGAGGHMIITYDSTANSLVERNGNGDIFATTYRFNSNNTIYGSRSIELYSELSPFIDFHYANSSDDYTSRIIENTSGHLQLLATNGVQVNSEITSVGFVKSGSDNNYLLLAGGSHKPVSDFVDRTNNQSIGGTKSFYSKDAIGGYSTRAVELREVNLVTDTQTNPSYSPAIGFHWSGFNASVISMHKDGHFYFTDSNSSSTNYKYLYCKGIVKSGSTDSYVLLGGGGHKLISEITGSGGDADTLNGLRSNQFIMQRGTLDDINTSPNSFAGSYRSGSTGAPVSNSYGTLLLVTNVVAGVPNVAGTWIFQLAHNHSTLELLWRGVVNAEGWTSWKALLTANGGTLTGSLKIQDGGSNITGGIQTTAGNGLLIYNGTTSTYLSQLAGTTYIRSGDTNLIHRRNGTDHSIWDSRNTESPFCVRGVANASHVDLTNVVANAPGFIDYESGTYSVSRTGATDLYIKFMGSNSTSGLEFLTSYGDANNFYFRKVVDHNRISGPWRIILTDINYNNFAPTKTGVGAAGTWGISITGNAATATTATTASKVANSITFTGGATGTYNGSSAVTVNIPAAYSLPTASASVLGGIKVGAGLSISSGVLSATGGGVADSVAWANVVGKPTTISGYGITDAVSTSDSRLTNSRPASDVSAWAKASTKPSYSWSEITSKPSLSYLPLTGGNITGALGAPNVLCSNTNTAGIIINKAGTDYIGIGGNGGTNKVYISSCDSSGNWTSNYGSQSLDIQMGSLSWNGNALARLIDLTWGNVTGKPSFASVATSGNYNDLSNRPTIPSAYTLPASTAAVLGGIKVGYTTSGLNYKVQVDSSNNAYVNVPWTDTNTTYNLATTSANGLLRQLNGSTALYMRGDGTWATPPNTTYNAATSSAAGLMSAADKAKLDGVASGANAYSLPTSTASVLGGVKIGTGLGINASGLAYVSFAPLVQNSLTIKDGNTTTTWNGGAPLTIDITKPAGVETIDKTYSLIYLSNLGNSSRVALAIPADYPYGKRAKLSVRFSGRKTSGSGLAYDVDYKDIVILESSFDDYRGITCTALSTDYSDVSLVAISSQGYNVSPYSALLYFLSMNSIFTVVSDISATLSPI